MKHTVPLSIDARNVLCGRWHLRSQRVIIDITSFKLALDLILSFAQLYVKSKGSCSTGTNEVAMKFKTCFGIWRFMDLFCWFNRDRPSDWQTWRNWLTLADRRINLVASSNNVACIIPLTKITMLQTLNGKCYNKWKHIL